MTSLRDKPTLHGERVILRPMRADDADSLWALLADEEARRLTGRHASFRREQIDAWCASRGDQPDRLDLSIEVRADGSWAGEVVINHWDADNRSCNFRIVMAPAARNRGFGTEATRLLVDYVFDALDAPPVNRLSLEVYAFNERATAVYEKLGFCREGVLRQALRWDGAYQDAVVMSIVRADR